ncbi:hypothetical protein G9A89_011971 [Geosiphon pyriformis]|nr:hypothetical protein G9A89_011971 [Geosiphon pyriformis]
MRSNRAQSGVKPGILQSKSFNSKKEGKVSAGKRKRKESDGGHFESNKDDKDGITRYADEDDVENGSDDEASDSPSLCIT